MAQNEAKPAASTGAGAKERPDYVKLTPGQLESILTRITHLEENMVVAKSNMPHLRFPH